MTLNKLKHFIKINYQYIAFLLFVFLLPFTKKYLPYIIFLWVLTGLFSIRRIELKSFKYKILLILPFLFFLIHVIGFIYSDNLKSGLFDLEVKLSILFIPIISIFITEKVKINFRFILKIFVFGNLITSIICLIIAFSNSIHVNEFGNILFEPSYWLEFRDLSFFQLINERASFFSYLILSVFHHPSYFSVYILFSIATLVYLIRSSKKRLFGYYGLIIYFSIFIWLLGSRAGYITYLISFFSFIFIIILKFKKYWIGVGSLVIGVLLALIVLTNSQINKNIKETTNIVEYNQSLTNDSDMRLWIWKSGIEVFKDHFIFGVGTGDIDEFLNKKYQEYNLKDAELHHYNTHNQYLDVAIKFGIVGFIIFFAWIITIFLVSIKKKQFLFFYFGLIIFINFFFETMLNTIAGVGFVSFFYALLYSMYNKKD